MTPTMLISNILFKHLQFFPILTRWSICEKTVCWESQKKRTEINNDVISNMNNDKQTLIL